MWSPLVTRISGWNELSRVHRLFLFSASLGRVDGHTSIWCLYGHGGCVYELNMLVRLLTV
jgi:hypothetical protein